MTPQIVILSDQNYFSPDGCYNQTYKWGIQAIYNKEANKKVIK